MSIYAMAVRQARRGDYKPLRLVTKMALRWIVHPVCKNCGGWNFSRPFRWTCLSCSEVLLMKALFESED